MEEGDKREITPWRMGTRENSQHVGRHKRGHKCAQMKFYAKILGATCGSAPEYLGAQLFKLT